MIEVLVVGGIFREVFEGADGPSLRFGGSGFSAAVAAARLGAQVSLASYVGTDDEEVVRGELQFAGVDDTPVITVDGACGTFLFPSRLSDERPWPMYRPAEAVPYRKPTVPAAQVLLVFGIPDFDPVAAGWLAGLRTADALLWDRQGWLSRARDATGVLFVPSHQRIYLANASEALEDAGVSDLGEALSAQPPSGFDAAVIKQGDTGVTVFDARDATPRTVLAFSVDADSTVGSGDVFAGALAARLVRSDPLGEAARWGCAAAAVALSSSSNLLRESSAGEIARLLSRPERTVVPG